MGKRFLFITANDHETKALLADKNFFRYTPDHRSDISDDDSFYNVGFFGKYEVVHLQLQDQGSVKTGASLLSIAAAIDFWKPDAVILVGIAFGKDNEQAVEPRQHIGDVLISERVADYESGKIKDSEFQSDAPILNNGKTLLSVFKNFHKSWHHPVNDRQSQCHFGLVLSGDKVIDDAGFKEKLFAAYPRAKGGEMEGRGAASACRVKRLEEWIIVKAICDWGENKGNPDKDRDQRIAAEAAVSLLKHVFSNDAAFNKLPKRNTGDAPPIIPSKDGENPPRPGINGTQLFPASAPTCVPSESTERKRESNTSATAFDLWDRTRSSRQPMYIDCRHPLSFYGIMEALSQGTKAERVLHRIRDLLRKYEQTESGTRLTAHIEWHAEGLPSFALEDKHLSMVTGTRVISECVILTVFDAEVNESNLHEISSHNLLVHCVIKRNHGVKDAPGNVWEAIVHPHLLLNHHVNGIRNYGITVGGRNFDIKGIYFCQQNGSSGMCAESALAMALRAMGKKMPNGKEPTPAEVAEMMPSTIGKGRTLNEMVRVLRAYDLEPMAIAFRESTARDVDYRSLVHMGVESGLPVLLAFITRDRKTGDLRGHVVTVLGYTLNTDAWAVETDFDYGAELNRHTRYGHSSPSDPLEHVKPLPCKYHPSYDWCTHWIINDDDRGMAYHLPTNRLTLPSDDYYHAISYRDNRAEDHLKEFNVIGIIVPFPSQGPNDIRGAEIKTIAYLRGIFGQFSQSIQQVLSQNQVQWLSRLERQLNPKYSGPGPVLQSRMLDRDTYTAHLAGGKDWDENRIDAADVNKVAEALPQQFWMTEYTLVDLFTTEQRKLGEILWTPAWTDSMDFHHGLLLTRAPGMIFLPQKNGHATTIVTPCWSPVPLLSPLSTAPLRSKAGKAPLNTHNHPTEKHSAAKQAEDQRPEASRYVSGKVLGERPNEPKKFKIGVTFTGTHRSRVCSIVNALRDYDLSKNEIFYDSWHDSFINGKNADKKLANVYTNCCECVVVFLSKDYNQKHWTRYVEWEAIAKNIATDQGEKIFLLNVDGVDIDKIDELSYFTDIAKNIEKYTDDEVAKIIWNKYRSIANCG